VVIRIITLGQKVSICVIADMVNRTSVQQAAAVNRGFN
jgi:hypothetical protein